MGGKIPFAGMMMISALLMMGGTAMASPPIQQPPPTDYMRSTVGTPDELSPLAPPEARNVRKVGKNWTCEINGQAMVYQEETKRWEPGLPERPTK